MNYLPQNNGDRVSISNRSDFRLALEAHNFHAEEVGSQRMIMRRLGPDGVIFEGQLLVRRNMTAHFVEQLRRDIQII
jgi:hypothetical protein